MKFVNIKGTQEISNINITLPETPYGFEYYYPDGITKGISKKKTYFIGRRNLFDGRMTYYQTPQEALEGNEDYFTIRDGKILSFGEVVITLRSGSKHTFKFNETKELYTYLDILESRWGIDFNSFVCLETPKLDSLYEHKSFRDNGFKGPLSL